MTLAPERPVDALSPATPVVEERQAQFSLTAELLNTHVLCNLIGESDLPKGVNPDDPELVYYDVPGAGRMYLEFQFCRSGAGRIHPFVVNTNKLLTEAYRESLENFPASPSVGPLNSSESERVRDLVAQWWLKPNAAIKFGTSTNPHHWYATTPREAHTPFDCLAQLHAERPRLLPDSIDLTLANATRNL